MSEKLLPRLTQLITNGSVVIMTLQCLFGCFNMQVYSAGRDLLKRGVISGEDMLPETAYVKLMWVLAHVKTSQEIKQLMRTNIADEIAERTKSNAFLRLNT